MSNFCINLENGRFFVYEQTLESKYLEGRFGAVPLLNLPVGLRPQFFHHPMKIEEPKKLASELRKMADMVEEAQYE